MADEAARPAKKPKPLRNPEAWREAKRLMWAHRRYLGIGLVLMLVSRVAGLVPAASSKYLIDNVLEAPGRPDLLLPLAGAVLLATLVQGVTSFALSQVISVTAQRAITDMRRRVQQHITRLPIRYFDSTQVGVLVSRVMNDAEGIRNLVGTGIVQLVGSVFTATLALGALLYLNWVLTLAIVVILAAFGAYHEHHLQEAAPHLSRARRDHRGGQRPADGDAGRHSRGQGVRHGKARAARVRPRRAPPVPQHRQLHHRHLGRSRPWARR